MPGYSSRWILLAIALVTIGCADQKGPAEAAVMKIESALVQIRSEASASAPDDLKNIEATLASLKNDLAKKNYQQVLANAPNLTSAVHTLEKKLAADVVASIDSEFGEVWEEAARVGEHENVQSVKASLASMKADLASGNYQAVRANASYLTSAVDRLKRAVADRKAEREAIFAAVNAKARADWDSLSSEVTRMIDAIQSRVDVIGKSGKLPSNVSRDDFDYANTWLNSVKIKWAEATSEFASASSDSAIAASENGTIDAKDALSKGRWVRSMGSVVLKKLRMAPV